MSDYSDAAPNVSKFKSATEFEDDFPVPGPASSGSPEPTAGRKLALYNAYVAEYNSNSGAVQLRRLSRSMDVPHKWVLILHDEVRAALAVVRG